MRKRDLAFLGVILCVALAIRVWAPWGDVFGPARVNFLESDAWYHVRLVENQVRHFPHHVTHDPYASIDGQFIAVAPLLDTIVASAVVLTRGPSAPTAYIERVAALAPPVMGVLAVVAVWTLASRAFDRRAGLIAAFLTAVLPGHFLDRTLVGFVDHHALEAWLAMATLAAIVTNLLPTPDAAPPDAAALKCGPTPRLPTPDSRLSVSASRLGSLLPGFCLGLYLLAWGSGAFLVAILAVWVVLLPLVGASAQATAAARVAAITAAVALVVVLAFQDSGLFRYNTQIASLAGLLAVSLVVAMMRIRLKPDTTAGIQLRPDIMAVKPDTAAAALKVAAVVAGVGVVLAGAATIFAPGLVAQVGVDLARFRPDPTRMAVLEARPLFLYSGNWDWWQPWTFFRSGFYLGALALALLARSIRRSRRLDHLLIAIFTLATFIATIGQNRFGYYLVPAVSVVIGWWAARVLDWGGVPHAANPSPQVRPVMPMQREVAVILVAALAVAPNIVPAAITTIREGGMPDYWFAAMEWLRHETPEPFGTDEYYYARYTSGSPVIAATAGAPVGGGGYTVMNWWDQGYWLIQTAHRVPVSNPTQVRAPNAAKFYTATDEAAALSILAAERARYVVVDWEQPFRDGENGALAGRFESLADWSGAPTSEYYTLCYAQSAEGWQPVWIFREPYYQSMVYRLMVLGGVSASPTNNTWVVHLEDRVDTTGRAFCEVVDRKVYAAAGDAIAAARQQGDRYHAVGLTPWQPAFPVKALTELRPIREFRNPGQAAHEAPMVRVFEVRREK